MNKNERIFCVEQKVQWPYLKANAMSLFNRTSSLFEIALFSQLRFFPWKNKS